MAQPIVFQAPEQQNPVTPQRLRNAPAEHAEALLSAYDLLQSLHDRGVLNLLRGLVDGGDAVVGTVAEALNTPESIRGIRNLLLLARCFANVPPDVLTNLAQTLSDGVERKKSQKAP